MSDSDVLARLRALESAMDQTKVIERPFTARRVRAFNSANLAIVTATQTTLTYDSELWDTDGMHSTAALTNRLTCVTPGAYLIGAEVRWESNTTGYRQVFIRVTPIIGAPVVIGSRLQQAVVGNVTDMGLSAPYVLATGDYAEVLVFHTAGVNINVQAASRLSPDFWALRIA